QPQAFLIRGGRTWKCRRVPPKNLKWAIIAHGSCLVCCRPCRGFMEREGQSCPTLTESQRRGGLPSSLGLHEISPEVLRAPDGLSTVRCLISPSARVESSLISSPGVGKCFRSAAV